MYWSALAEWLAAGRLAGARAAFAPSPPVLGELARAYVDADSTALLRTPAGASRPAGPFVPADTGVHVLVDARGRVLAGTPAVSAARAAASHPYGRAALLAYGSGGTALPRAALRDWLARRNVPPAPRAWLPWALLAGVLASFLGAWTLRRYRGAP